MRSNQDESDSEEYDKDMDIDKEIIVKVMCNAAAADWDLTAKYAVLTILS